MDYSSPLVGLGVFLFFCLFVITLGVWAATGIVVSWYVCLDSHHTTSY